MDCKDVYKIREKGMTKRRDANSIEEIIYKTKKEMKKYKELILDFFGDYKEAKTIRQLYEKLHNSLFVYEIQYMDLTRAFEIYKEYNQGMFQFVDEIFKREFEIGNDTYEDYKIKLNRAKNEDYHFICSIFGEMNNAMKYVPIRDTMQNIEVLIPLIDFICEIEKELCSVLDHSKKCEKTICKDTIRMFCESVSHFVSEMIKNSCDYYIAIQEELAHPKMKKDDPNRLDLF